MRPRGVLIVGSAVVAMVALAACGGTGDGPERVATDIPRTTTSDEARQEFDTGLALVDRLRLTDAHEHFQRAVAADPDFAWGHMMLANTSPTAPDFWSSLRDAQDRAPSASEGERLLIGAFSAGVNGEQEQQRQLLEQLVTLYPDSARARTALGTFHFGRQDWDAAIEQYRQATALDPDFSPPYNQLGYALRFTGDFDGAEQAFRRYVELIPDEPNPYDSLAELLWKRGRFEESIATYRQALEHNPNFIASYVGIGNNQMLLGEYAAARETFDTLEQDIARTDGERRQACTWRAMTYLHEGDHDAALAEVERRRAIAEASNDRTAISADLNLMGNILLDAGRIDDAERAFADAVDMMAASEATDEVKEATRRTSRFNTGRVALARGDVDAASAIAEEYREAAKAKGIRFEIWQAHELAGMVELARGDASGAMYELELANQQDPRVMYLKAKALMASGNDLDARAMARQAAEFNGLSVTWPYVRDEATAMAGI